MEWILLVLGGGGVAAAGRYVWFRRVARRRIALELEHIRRSAEADAIHFGEELARFSEGPDLDAEARHDYQTALDAYESAKRAVDHLHSAESVTAVVDTLTAGRYALACVRARVAGEPLPERRTPCFFDPRHGPSSTEVVWTPRNGPTRKVPACAQVDDEGRRRRPLGQRPRRPQTPPPLRLTPFEGSTPQVMGLAGACRVPTHKLRG